MFGNQLIQRFDQTRTPFYFYDTGLLHKTLFAIKEAASLYNYHIHYAVKANANERILGIIRDYDLGADCVSANEIQRALDSGIDPKKIVFAGVGKTDEEIRFAINHDIFSINCESVQELEVINKMSFKANKITRVALRINPNIDAKTHHYITTGLNHNKFGISFQDLEYIIENKDCFQNIIIDGVHFHIGSQITQLNVFRRLCVFVNDILKYFSDHRIKIIHINLGGGLGINYPEPENQIPDFQAYFEIFKKNLDVKPWQSVHFEPGRSIVGQCGAIISRVLYVKDTGEHQTIIIDSGFTELLRPALYQANHKIINLTSNQECKQYDIAGPICETSDYFGKSIMFPKTSRGDLIAILSTGAYGETMASQYNLRTPAAKYFSDDFNFGLQDETIKFQSVALPGSLSMK